MVKVRVIEDFTLKDFDKLLEIKRANASKDKKGKLYLGDTFKCEDTMVDYLSGANALKKAFIEIIEVEPKKEEETPKEEESVENIEEESEPKITFKKNKRKKAK